MYIFEVRVLDETKCGSDPLTKLENLSNCRFIDT